MVQIVFSINAERSLIPALLSSEKPPDFEWHWPVLPAATFSDVQFLLPLLESYSSLSHSQDEKTRCVGRVYRFPFVPSGFFGRVIVRILNSLSIASSTIQSDGSSPSFTAQHFSGGASPAETFTLPASLPPSFASSSPASASAPLHPAILALWADGIVLRLNSTERLFLGFEPVDFRLHLNYRFLGVKPGKAWHQAVAAINNLISEWYQVPAVIDVLCCHCLEEGRRLSISSTPVSSSLMTEEDHEDTVPTLFKLSHCEIEYYKGRRTVECIRRIGGRHFTPERQQSFSIGASLSGGVTALLSSTLSVTPRPKEQKRDFKHDHSRTFTISPGNLRSILKKDKKESSPSMSIGRSHGKSQSQSLFFSTPHASLPWATKKSPPSEKGKEEDDGDYTFESSQSGSDRFSNAEIEGG